jgi:hypothetical protein
MVPVAISASITGWLAVVSTRSHPSSAPSARAAMRRRRSRIVSSAGPSPVFHQRSSRSASDRRSSADAPTSSRRLKRNRLRATLLAGWLSPSRNFNAGVAALSSAISSSLSSLKVTAGARPSLSSASPGSQLGVSRSKSFRAVTMTVIAGTSAAARTRSVTVIRRAGSENESRLSTNRSAPPSLARSDRNASGLISIRRAFLNPIQPPGGV